ncbi:MAG: hypothetical protein S0880_23385 [Actinomycetota bacterium]|nr:hypothetical protein [Actinomycetota bacterium]
MRRIITLLGAVFALVLAWSAPAGAGGWAVTTLDPLDGIDAAAPGTTIDVGFTVRQHGVHPVDLSGPMKGGGAAIEIVDGSGEVLRFDAAPDGAVGHHVATVELPAAGEYEWRVVQGGFGPQDLGTLVVGGGAAGVVAADGGTWPAVARYGLPVLALAAAAYALAGPGLAGRRRVAAPVGA